MSNQFEFCVFKEVCVHKYMYVSMYMYVFWWKLGACGLEQFGVPLV